MFIACNRVDATIPLDVATSLNQSIFSEPEEGEDIPFTLAHLKEPQLNMRNSVEVSEDEEMGKKGEGDIGEDEEEGGEGLFQVSFPMDNDQDRLY